MRWCFRIVYLLLCVTACIFGSAPAASTYDIVIYGGTSSGVIAALQAAKMGRSVVVIEPGAHLGGMTSGGIGRVDRGLVRTVGGLTRHYFDLVAQYYHKPDSWIWQSRDSYLTQMTPKNRSGRIEWLMEPHAAERVFKSMIAASQVAVVFHERLDRQSGVQKTGPRITQITMESGRSFQGSMFIDASYEGDLMAAAGVSYIIGRESNSTYQETQNGYNPDMDRDDMPHVLIDPYVIKQHPESGLLPRISSGDGREVGSADKEVQAYGYRLCLTNVPENRMSIKKPTGYLESDYELLFRAIDAGMPKEKFLKLDPMPNRKTDSNNNGPISMDYVGASDGYIEAEYATREQIALAHERWQRGLLWTLQNHKRVPQNIREYYAPWGLARDEFVDNRHWPHQFYVREGRRMVSPSVMTEDIVVGTSMVKDGVAFGSYAIDSHVVRYIVATDGFLTTEGSIYEALKNPYLISYRSIVPRQKECENLLVPVCLSASHVAYGSIRMEPVFMMLGQAAATAASLAIGHGKIPVQEVSYDDLRAHLLADGQILQW